MQARVPTFVWLFLDDATTAKGPGCDEGTNLRLCDFGVVLLMPTRVKTEGLAASIRKLLSNADGYWPNTGKTADPYLMDELHEPLALKLV